MEVSSILRGSVFGSERRQIAPVVADQFGYVEANLLAAPDIRAGKLCAELDRQHPRDIFDAEYIVDAGVMDDRLRTAFLVYLISHNRPISELLAPNEKEFDRAFVEDREFLIDFKKGEPNWDHLGIDHVSDLPAVRWKQQNLERMTPQARRASIRRLEQVLEES